MPLSMLSTTEMQLFLDWQWMDGRLCFKGQTGHWSSLGSLGVTGRCHAARCQRTHGYQFQPHTAAGYQNAKPDRSSFRASLGSVWGRMAGGEWTTSCSPTKDAQIQERRADIARRGHARLTQHGSLGQGRHPAPSQAVLVGTLGLDLERA